MCLSLEYRSACNTPSCRETITSKNGMLVVEMLNVNLIDGLKRVEMFDVNLIDRVKRVGMLDVNLMDG